MIVTVVAMRMMQVTIDQVIHMVAMRNRLVAAAFTMDVSGFMTAALVRSATARVRSVDLQAMLFDDSILLVMQVPIMEIIDVAAVLDGDMAALRAMLVRMVLVLVF